MAPRFDVVGDTLRRLSGAVIDYNSAYTFEAYFKMSVNRGDWGTVIAIYNNDTNADNIELYSDGSSIRMTIAISNNYYATTPVAVNVGQWYHVAMVRESATSAKFYLDGVLQGTITNSVAGRVASVAMSIGVGPYPTDWINGVVAAVKAYNASHTIDQINAERFTLLPVNPGIWGFWPGLEGERGKDYSGNSHHYTEGGTLTDESGPPITWSFPQNPPPVIASSGPSLVSVSDAATPAEMLALLSSAAFTDLARGVDTLSSPQLFAAPIESTQAAESLLLLQIFATLDASIASDDLSSLASSAPSDSSRSSDQGNSLGLYPVSDSVLGTDSSSQLMSALPTDAGSSSDLAAAQLGFGLVETASSQEASASLGSSAPSEAGSGQDSNSSLAMLSQTEGGSGTDDLSSLLIAQLADVVAQAEQFAAQLGALLAEAGSSSETPALDGSVLASDASSTTEGTAAALTAALSDLSGFQDSSGGGTSAIGSDTSSSQTVVVGLSEAQLGDLPLSLEQLSALLLQAVADQSSSGEIIGGSEEAALAELAWLLEAIGADAEAAAIDLAQGTDSATATPGLPGDRDVYDSGYSLYSVAGSIFLLQIAEEVVSVHSLDGLWAATVTDSSVSVHSAAGSQLQLAFPDGALSLELLQSSVSTVLQDEATLSEQVGVSWGFSITDAVTSGELLSLFPYATLADTGRATESLEWDPPLEGPEPWSPSDPIIVSLAAPRLLVRLPSSQHSIRLPPRRNQSG